MNTLNRFLDRKPDHPLNLVERSDLGAFGDFVTVAG